MSEFAKLAQDFVEATSLLVGQRTINIMDQKGIIIASTEKHRIGDFHQGASEVLATGKPVRIKKRICHVIREPRKATICRSS